MENREILIANTKTQKRSKLTTNATTLGELKEALDDAGIDYSGMTFTEGISKTQLLDDETQLPQNVMYKGQPTNNLVMLLTNTKKNIASGAGSRKEAYETIKKYNCAEAIKEKFGTNYTHVATIDLWAFLEKNDGGEVYKSEVNPIEEPKEDTEETIESVESCQEPIEHYSSHSQVIAKSIFDHIGYLVNAGIFDYSHIKHFANALNLMADEIKDTEEQHEISVPVSTSDGKINDDDIDNMLEELNV